MSFQWAIGKRVDGRGVKTKFARLMQTKKLYLHASKPYIKCIGKMQTHCVQRLIDKK